MNEWRSFMGIQPFSLQNFPLHSGLVSRDVQNAVQSLVAHHQMSVIYGLYASHHWNDHLPNW